MFDTGNVHFVTDSTLPLHISTQDVRLGSFGDGIAISYSKTVKIFTMFDEDTKRFTSCKFSLVSTPLVTDSQTELLT